MSANTAKNQTKPLPEGLASKIEALPLLSECLPHKFSDGPGEIQHLAIDCGCCGQEIRENSIRGAFISKAGGLAADLKAYAVCYGCQTITPMTGIFDSDGGLKSQMPDGSWKSGTWDARKLTAFEQAKIAARRVARRHGKTFIPPLICFLIVGCWILAYR